jgi:hypothetical protein
MTTLPSSAEVKNKLSFTSSLPYALMGCTETTSTVLSQNNNNNNNIIFIHIPLDLYRCGIRHYST